MTRALVTMTTIAIALLAMIVMVSPGSASSSTSTIDVGKLAGTRTSWDVDVDWNGSPDSNVVMDSFSIVDNNASMTRCSVTFQSTVYGEYSVNNVDPTFESVDLVIDHVNNDERIYYQSQNGVIRKAVNRPATINGTFVGVFYDIETGLLLQVNFTLPSGVDTNYIRMAETSAFSGYSTGIPYIWFFAVAFTIAAVVFITAATVHDKKIRSREACFSAECW